MERLIPNCGGFLYFPEDKATYIPAAIEKLLIFRVVFSLFKWLRKNSAKQAAEAKKLEERAFAERDERMRKETEL